MSYTKVAKPGAQTYTIISKPAGSFAILKGMATGLLISPTYATNHTLGTSYTNILKPTGTSYTNILKPT